MVRIDMEWVAGVLGHAGLEKAAEKPGAAEGVSTDSRAIVPGSLFVAIRGDRYDGHDFLAEAVRGGASALVVFDGRRGEAEALSGGMPVFAVKDTLEALQSLARAWCSRISPRVVGITGTTGKTGTKDMIASAVGRVRRVHATKGNLNNHIGLPLTVLSMPGDTEVLVAEMGASGRGEIRNLCTIAPPSVGVITNIGPGHLERFGSLKGVAVAKAELIEALPEEGTAVLPASGEFSDFLAGRTGAGVTTFGLGEEADVRIEDIESREGGGFRFRLLGEAMEIRRYGRHNLLNAAAAAAAAGALGVPAEETAAALAETGPEQGRGRLFEIDGTTFVDESYNSNPDSLRAAVEAFMEMPVDGSRFLVLGDMLELGDGSAELHAGIGVFCGRAGVDGILTLGSETVELSREAAAQKRAPGYISHFIDVSTLAANLETRLAPGDAVLVKGSRGMRMETVMEEIEKMRSVRRRRVG